MYNFFKKKNNLPIDREYFLSLFSGIEGGLATTSAIISGLVISGLENVNTIKTIAIISFTVQAFNGAVGRFSGEHTNDEIDNIEEIEGYKKPMIDALLQFISHVGFSLLILVPFFYLNSVYAALVAMVLLTLFLMFCLGATKGMFVHNKLKKDGMELVYMAILVIVVGSIAGLVTK